jgi:hypothetical protein
MCGLPSPVHLCQSPLTRTPRVVLPLSRPELTRVGMVYSRIRSPRVLSLSRWERGQKTYPCELSHRESAG